LRQISSFLVASIAELGHEEKSRTQSLIHSIIQSPSLSDAPETEDFGSEKTLPLLCNVQSWLHWLHAAMSNSKREVTALYNFILLVWPPHFLVRVQQHLYSMDVPLQNNPKRYN